MNRAERRRSRTNEKTKYEVQDIARHCKKDEEMKYMISALMTCFALAERKTYRFGKKRINRTLDSIDELMGDILEGKKSIQDYTDELEKQTGVILRCH